MLRKFLWLLFFAVFISCGDDEKGPERLPVTKDSTVKSFFPVTEYLKGQLAELDSIESAPLKIITVNNKADSFWLRADAIRPFAQPFLHPVMDSISLAKYFASSSFLDQTIAAFTFSYDPVIRLPDTITVKRWDVYVDPEKNTVKRIFIVKQSGDTMSQLTWTTDWCKIVTIKGDKVEREEKMIWNFK